ncbi:ankyrin repeat domain-containing protein 40-like [Pollicipes pollicipes]|uniref:ankyrin repeat domain-containing protein 40-like n=1 Tax=Pollicipes pollicipes TaxID=41117 RepID=UPI001884F017|nr:ankyrin repeat domain-containing protein 40-like [Pollicipes pollicipes]
MSEEHVREEQLREAACVGDLKALRELMQNGVNVNSKNAVNGWSALHWGCKRGRLEAVRILLDGGADITANNNAGQVPAQLTSNSDILRLMGVEVANGAEVRSEPPSEPTFTPSYITYPATSVDLAPSRLHGGDGGAAEPAAPNGVPERRPPAELGAACRLCHCQRLRPAKGVVPDDELVLKVRVAGVPDNADFIELEMSTAELTMDRLLRECCRELNIEGQVIDRVRKLPNTILRRDRDVRRPHRLPGAGAGAATTAAASLGSYRMPDRPPVV